MSENQLKSYAFLIGMPRAATTYLYHSLSNHPEVCVPYKRKTNFFSLHFDRNYSWFKSNFKPMLNEKIGIDTETLSFIDFSLKGHENIKFSHPKSKVVLIVREPEEWTVSLYKQVRTFDNNIGEFKNFIEGRYFLTEDDKKIRFNYSDGKLQEKIEEIKNLFKGRLLIVDFKKLSSSPVEFMHEIESFLNLREHFVLENVITNKINSSDRKGNKVMNLLMRSTLFTTLVRIFFPAKIILSIRKKMDQAFSEVTTKNQNDEDFSLVKGLYGKDKHYICELFMNNWFIKC